MRAFAVIIAAASVFSMNEIAVRAEYTGTAAGLSNLGARIDYTARLSYTYGMAEIRTGIESGALFDMRAPDIPVSLLGTISIIKPFTAEAKFDVGAALGLTAQGPFRDLSYHAGIVLSHDGENNALIRHADVRVTYEYISTAVSALRISTLIEMPFKVSVLLFEWRHDAAVRISPVVGVSIEEALFFDLMSITKANPLVVQLSDESLMVGILARVCYNTYGAAVNTPSFGGAAVLAYRF